MRRPIVFAAQEPHYKNNAGQWVSKGLNLAAASEFGDLVIVWPPDTSIFSRELIENTALGIADKYDDRRDFIIALGSPTLIAVLSWAIGYADKEIRMLEWDKEMSKYVHTLSGANV